MALPLVMAGWLSENEVVKVPLFSRYVDQPSKPFTGFRVVLKVRHSTLPFPELLLPQGAPTTLLAACIQRLQVKKRHEMGRDLSDGAVIFSQ